MLVYILAIAVGLSSLALYLTAFFSPTLQRKDDFLWSGVGLFYALVLWVCAGRITGGVLLGQAASVALVLSFGWQTLKLRRAIANPDKAKEIESFSLLEWMQNLIGKGKLKKQPSPPATQPERAVPPRPETAAVEPIAPATTTEEKIEVAVISETAASSETVPAPTVEESSEILNPEITEESTTETLTPETPEETVVQAPQIATAAVTGKVEAKPETPQKKGFSWKNLFSFGKRKPKPQPESQPAKITQALDSIETETELEGEDWDVTEASEVVATPVAATPPSLDTEEKAPQVQDLFLLAEEEDSEPTEPSEGIPIEVEEMSTSTEATLEVSTAETVTLQEKPVEVEAEIDFDFDEDSIDGEAETMIEDYQPEIETAQTETEAEAIHEFAPEQPATPVEETPDKNSTGSPQAPVL